MSWAIAEVEAEAPGSGSDYSVRSDSERVAIVLASLKNSLAVNLLKKFDPEDVKQILESSSRLGALKSGDVEPLVDDFAVEFSEALGISAGHEQLMALLESAFSAEDVANFLGRPINLKKESVWSKFTLGMETVLVPYLLDEHEQTSAVILAKLPSELTSRCLSMLPRGSRGRIAMRMLKLMPVTPEVMTILEDTLSQQLFSKIQTVDESANRDLVASIVNKLDREHAEELLQDVGAQNPEILKALRKLIFQFDDITRLDQKHRLKLFDRIPADVVVASLFGKDQDFREIVLNSIGARSRRMIESELQGDTSQPRKDTATSRRKISDVAIQMAKKGEIDLPSVDTPGGSDEPGSG